MAAASTVQPWTVGRTYKPGDLVAYDGVTYQALQGETAIATWAPSLTAALWKPISGPPSPTPAPVPAPTPTPAPAPAPTPTGSAPAWSTQAIYTAGMTASENGLTYRANWWTQGNDPAAANGPAGSGQPWTLLGPALPTTAVPTAPTSQTPVQTPVQTPGAPTPAAGAKVFAPYVDMGLTADDDLVALSRASGVKTFTLAFIQSSGPGTVGWGGTGTLATDTLANGTTVQSQVRALEAIGGSAIISFGGAAGTDPAAAAPTASALQAQYQSVLDRYGVSQLDFDIEGAEVADTHAIALRDQALISLRAANPSLTISFTLPVLPTGLDGNGTNVLAAAKRDGLTPDVVNVMAMDYGAGADNGGAMGRDAVAAAQATLTQLGTLGLASKLGITPMIGVNDVSTEVFTLSDAALLESFAAANPAVQRLAMWSLARDNGASAGAHWAAPDSSGLAQSAFAFAGVLKAVSS